MTTNDIMNINYNARLNINTIDDLGHQYYLTLHSLFTDILSYSTKYIHTDICGSYYICTRGNTIFIYFEENYLWINRKLNFNPLRAIVESIQRPVKAYRNSDHPWKCNSSFLRVWKTMNKDIENTVESIINSHHMSTLLSQDSENPISLIENIVCVGYSAGAVLCGLCVEDLSYLFKDRYTLNIYGYGFGCPRFLKGKLHPIVAKRFKNFYVIRNANDLITSIPSKIWGYSHGPNKPITLTPLYKYNCIEAHSPESYSRETTRLLFSQTDREVI